MPEVLILFLFVLLILVVGWVAFEVINRMGMDAGMTRIARVVVGIFLLVVLLWLLFSRTGFLAGSW